MINGLLHRARRAKLIDRIDARVVSPASMQLDDLNAQVDFAFAFAVVHEMPSPTVFYTEAARALKAADGERVPDPGFLA